MGLTRQTLGCGTHRKEAAEPLRAQWEVAVQAVRGEARRSCGFQQKHTGDGRLHRLNAPRLAWCGARALRALSCVPYIKQCVCVKLGPRLGRLSPGNLYLGGECFAVACHLVFKLRLITTYESAHYLNVSRPPPAKQERRGVPPLAETAVSTPLKVPPPRGKKNPRRRSRRHGGKKTFPLLFGLEAPRAAPTLPTHRLRWTRRPD